MILNGTTKKFRFECSHLPYITQNVFHKEGEKTLTFLEGK